MQPLVSICIPTYNRAECLKITIESIICQPEFKSGKVEIVVSDNASTDSTEEVCRQYSVYDNFFYNRNPENVPDKNFPIVLSEAHGKLRKLNNDTFVLNRNALKNLCCLAGKYEKTRPFVFLCNEKGAIKELDFHGFIMEVGYKVTWITSFTIWDSECIGIESDTDGIELRLWQVRKALELAYQKNAAVVYSRVLGNSITPPKKNVSYGLYQVFYCNFMKLLQPFIENRELNDDDIDSLEKDLLFDFFLSWVINYQLNNTDMQYSKEEDLKAAVWNHYQNKPYWDSFVKKYNQKFVKARIKSFIKRILGKE